MEIFCQSFWKLIFWHQECQLLHCGCSFWVSNTIKDRISDMSVSYSSSDWMSSDHLILMISPTLSCKEWSHSGLIFDGFAIILDFFQTEVTDVVSKTFIQPKVIPPFHSYQVSKPMMSKLMRNRIGELELGLSWNSILPNVPIVMSNNSRIFHGTPLVLMCENLIILVESILVSKEFLEKLHRLDCDLKDKWGHFLHILVERFDTVKWHWNSLNLW